MAHYELDEEQRIRTRHALLKDENDLKRMKKSNLEEGLDVGDIDKKLHILRGEADGRPGLIQMFSSQTELFDESKAKKKVDVEDPAQMSIEDAMNMGGSDGTRWVGWVPEPRPMLGQNVLGLDDEKYTIVDILGFEPKSADVARGDDQAIAPEDGLFAAFVVPAHRAGGYTVDDKRKMHMLLAPEGPDDAEPWQQVISPPVDVSAVKEAVHVGIEAGAADTAEVETKPRRRGRPRAAAGNLAGAVKKQVAKATGDRKLPVGGKRKHK